MNYPVIGRVLSWILCTEGALLLLPSLISLIYREDQGMIYFALALLALAIGYVTSRRKIRNKAIYQREGFVSVGLSWVLLSLYGAIPFVLTGEIPSYVDAVFEIVSGFTTTGSSILSDVEALSHTSLFWRSFSHWIGGMGVLVFILMLMPTNRGGTQMNLMKAESPGPDVSKFVPRVRNTAIVLYKIYLGMTLLMIALLAITVVATSAKYDKVSLGEASDTKYQLFYGGEANFHSHVGSDDLFWGFKHNWRHYFSFMHELHSGVVNDYALWAVVALALAILYAFVIL